MTSTRISRATFVGGVTMSHVIFETDFTEKNIVYLKFKFNRATCIFVATSGNPSC